MSGLLPGLPGFTRFISDVSPSIGFYRVPLDFTGFRWVLMGFIGRNSVRPTSWNETAID